MRFVTDNTLFQKIISTSTVNKILCVSVLGVVIYGLRIFFGRGMSCIHDCRGVTKTIKELVCGLFEKSSKAEQKAVPPKIENIQEKKVPETNKQEKPKTRQIKKAEVPRIEDENASEIKKEEKKKISEIEEIKEPTAPKTKKEEPRVVPKIEDEKTSEVKEEEKKKVPKIEELEQKKVEEKKKIPEIEEIKEPTASETDKQEETEPTKIEAFEEKETPKIEELEEEEAGVDEEVVSESKPNPSAMSPRERSAEYQKSIEKIDQEMEQHTSRLNIESCHWENDALNVILHAKRLASEDIRVYYSSDKTKSPSITIQKGNPGHHLIYGLSVALKKPFFRLCIFTRAVSLITGSVTEREKKLNQIKAETCCQGFTLCDKDLERLERQKQLFSDTDLKNLDSICEFLFNIMNPKENQTVCLLETDVWHQVDDLLEKLETYAEWVQDANAYQLFRCFKSDIEQLQLLAPRPNNTKSARKT